MTWTKFIFVHTCGGLKVEGRTREDVRGSEILDLSAQNAVVTKERTAAASAEDLMAKGYRAIGRTNTISSKSRGKGAKLVVLELNLTFQALLLASCPPKSFIIPNTSEETTAAALCLN